jgi:O-antigen ligase
MSPALKAHFPVALIFFCFVLFPFGRSVELPVLIMTVSGIVIAFQHRSSLMQMPAIRLFSLLVLCIWIPMLLSFPDTYSVKKTGGTIIVFFRLYFTGLFVIWALQDSQRVQQLVKMLAGLTAFWVADALFQAAIGRDLLGFAQVPTRLNGVFGETEWSLGVALPVMIPFLLLTLREKPLGMISAFLASAAVEIMTGSRGGWISFALVCGLILWSETRKRNIALWKMGTISALIAVVGLFAVFQNPGARARLDQTLLLFSGDEASLDRALSNRWTLWKVGVQMIEAHPVNGVGIRAFRFAYPEYASPGDPMVNPDRESGKITGAAYAHQIVLEVFSEAGIIGLLGLMVFYAVLIRAWRRADASDKIRALPFALASLAWLFPLNTHTAFYSSRWSQFIWLVLALYCASLLNRPSSTLAR